MLRTQENVSISIQLYSLWEDLLSAYIFDLSLEYLSGCLLFAFNSNFNVVQMNYIEPLKIYHFAFFFF